MEKITSSTQDHLDILDIKNNLVVLKDGSVCAVLKTTAVNFALLAEIEQDAIIAAFSMLLNSISFPMQVLVRSKKLDITKYIEKVQRVERQITDPLLKYQAESYRKLIQDVIKKNDVLDKKFYVVIPAGGSTTIRDPGTNPFDWLIRMFGGHTKRVNNIDIDKALQTSIVELSPKIDHVTKEFNRIGVRTKQLDTQELVELYFDIYNTTSIQGQRIRANVEDYKTAIVNPAILDE